MLLIGGGVASASAAVELRKHGYDGPVTLVTRELQAPYHRPPISKGLLRGSSERVDVLSDTWWADNDVQLLTRSAVLSLDTSSRTARLATKQELTYDRAMVATGAMVRRLNVDGAALKGIHYLRAPMNAASLSADLTEPRNVVMVGGSFIAAEVAAGLTAMGHHCTMVMLEDQCLGSSFGGTVAGYVDALLRSRGVNLVCAAEVAAFEGEDAVNAVRTTDGRTVPADVVVVGVGAVPDVKLARSAGLEVGQTGGIGCDSRLRTSDPYVYAAGDVCEYDSALHGRRVRIEHERHAQAQGATAARNMLGLEEEHREVPYFWTDLADWATLEYVGLAERYDEEVVTGALDASFTVWHLAQGRLVSAVTRGQPDDLDRAREVMARGGRLPHDVIELSDHR